MIIKIGFGGGCHWCTESVFQSLEGVLKVDQGWIASIDDNTSFSEAVILEFNDAVISLQLLIQIHLKTHSSTSNHAMRTKYRSAVYSFDREQHNRSEKIIDSFQASFKHQLITQVFPFKSFKPSPIEFQNYYLKNPKKPFCKKYIIPKLDMLKDEFTDFYKTKNQ